MKPIRILIADDHTLFRRGLQRILEEHPEFSVVAEAASGIEAVELARRLEPHVAIVDIGMNDLNGVEATSQILRHSPATAVLILSAHSDERYVVRAMRAGARGYLLKDSVEEVLVRAIHRVCEGGAYFGPAVAKMLRDRWTHGLCCSDTEDRYDLLTERERQIFQMLAEGNANKDIANRLGLSVHTAETHRGRIMEKLGLHSVAELVLNAVRWGVVR